MISVSKPFFFYDDSSQIKAGTDVKWRTYSIDSSGGWAVIYNGSANGYLGFDVSDFIWSNHDIAHSTSGEIIFSGSDPELLPAEIASLQPKPEFQPIPQEIPEGQVLKIDTGLSSLPADDPQSVADSIMQTAIDGNLAPTVTIEADPTVTPDPDPDGSTETDPDGSTETDPDATTGWLSRILESIKSLPQQIAEAISSIFVPSPDFFPTAISNLKDAYSDRMGLLTYPISVLFDFLDRVLNLDDQPPILRWDSIYLPGYPGTPVVAAGQYNFNDTLSTSAGRQVHEIYLIVVDAIMILAFLDLAAGNIRKSCIIRRGSYVG